MSSSTFLKPEVLHYLAESFFLNVTVIWERAPERQRIWFCHKEHMAILVSQGVFEDVRRDIAQNADVDIELTTVKGPVGDTSLVLTE